MAEDLSYAEAVLVDASLRLEVAKLVFTAAQAVAMLLLAIAIVYASSRTMARTDEDTGCQYLTSGVFAGGITPRLDANGRHMGCDPIPEDE